MMRSRVTSLLVVLLGAVINGCTAPAPVREVATSAGVVVDPLHDAEVEAVATYVREVLQANR